MKLAFLCLVLATAQGAYCAPLPPPIVFVHGNGDDASKWMTVIWRFESNGYPRDRLFAVRFTDPVARTSDDVPLVHHSSTVDQASQLSTEVARALLLTGAQKVVLVGSSRGGMTIRNYLKNAGGAAVVSQAILCGSPNHGVFALDLMQANEFNGKGRFLAGLNTGSEIVPGVAFLTIRSDHNDKYAQPTGRAAGLPVRETGVTAEGPALAGAQNEVLPGLDHREVAFDSKAFALMYRFVMGKDPENLDVVPEAEPKISGLVTAFAGTTPTNFPQAGVRVRMFALTEGSAERNGAAVYEKVTDDTGTWGPVAVNPKLNYEFEMSEGLNVVRYFRSPFARSSVYVNLRMRPKGKVDALVVSRPQGYLSKDRDSVLVDGKVFDGIPGGVPTVDEFQVKPAGASVEILLKDERLFARPAGASENAIHVAEFNRD